MSHFLTITDHSMHKQLHMWVPNSNTTQFDMTKRGPPVNSAQNGHFCEAFRYPRHLTFTFIISDRSVTWYQLLCFTKDLTKSEKMNTFLPQVEQKLPNNTGRNRNVYIAAGLDQSESRKKLLRFVTFYPVSRNPAMLAS